MTRYVGGIDAGGTTFKCALRDAQGEWVARRRVPTTTPRETVARCADFFRGALAERALPGTALAGLGLASFGPLDLDRASGSYGTLLGTPKPGWSGFAVRQAFADALDVRVAIDTDVNAALLAEMRDGAAQGASNAAYVTVGTGIGAGIAADGRIIGRPRHPEFGHVPVSRAPADATFEGTCSYHGTCLEGMASVTALRHRFGDPVGWDAAHPGWDIAADYLVQACRSLYLTACADRIILGGGLMTSPHILPRIHTAFVRQMAGYLEVTENDAQSLITTPRLGDDAGLHGALLLPNQQT